MTAGEAVIAWVRPSAERQPNGLDPAPEPSAREREAEYARRARGQVRRWIRANRCAYMWTFTFREAVFDWQQLALAVDRFLRRLASTNWSKSGRETARPRFLLIGEPHPNGHGWHVHGATSTYIAHKTMAQLWGEGYVFVTRQRDAGRRWSPRKLAGYLSKYLGKSLEPEELHGCTPRPAWGHRYWVTQGHDPEFIRTWHRTYAEAVLHLQATYGWSDVECEFGRDEGPEAPGTWFGFPDTAVERWLKRVNAESRAQRGQR